ncbi:hypothetical protein CCT84_004627, partial [Escherichia coli]|nr:hypothetical protein [Escherichia coli]
SVTCGGLNKHGQWKKLSFLKDAMRSQWMWNMRQLLLKAWSEGMAMPESLTIAGPEAGRLGKLTSPTL